METVKSLRQSILVNDWTVSIDLTDAYLHVPIHPRSRKYLRFIFKDQFFQFTALPFGMSLSPWIFTKLMDVIVAHLRQRAITLFPYLDNWLIRDLIRNRLVSHTIYCLQTVQSLGVHSKSKEVRFDTIPEIHVYRDGISDTTEYSQGTSRPSRFSTADCQTVSFSDSSFGTNFSFSFGQTQCSSRLRSPRQTTLSTVSNVSFICLTFFLCNIFPLSNIQSSGSDQQYHSIPPDPNTFLFKDASHYGWGAHLELMRLSFLGCWSENQSQLHINMLEMMAIRLALRKAIKYIHHSCVMIATDNTQVVSYINKHGGTHSPNLCVEVWEILHWYLEYHIMIRVCHIPGRFNILADHLSRLDRPLKTEWALDQSVANSIFQMLNYPNVDLFATRFNHKLPLYVSPVPDNHALAIDTLSMNWNCLHA